MDVEQRRYCVYAIQSEITGRVYIGQTDLLQRRLEEHNNDWVKSTKYESPWKLFAIEYFQERSEARWAETRLKRSKGRRSKWLTENKV